MIKTICFSEWFLYLFYHMNAFLANNLKDTTRQTEKVWQ